MAISKDVISPPLEAGTSSVDSLDLPPLVREALGYVSGKLAQKHLHLAFVVVCDAQLLPQTPGSATPRPSSPAVYPLPLSPSLSLFSRRYLPALSGALRLRTGHSLSPAPPSSSPLTLQITSPEPPHCHTIFLFHAQTVPPKVARLVSQVFAKASKKFSVGDGGLPSPLTPISPSSPMSPAITPMTPLTPISPSSPSSPMSPSSPTAPTSPSTMNPTNDLVRRSLLQNDILSISEGLTLLSPDRVYTLKVALAVYAKACPQTLLPNSPAAASRNEEEVALAKAVENLRLLVLFQNGRCVTKSHLHAYEHLAVSLDILKRVNQEYRAKFKVDGIYDLGLDAPTHLVSWKARQPRLGRSKLAMAGGWGRPTPGTDGPAAHMDPNMVLKLDTNLTARTPKAKEPGGPGSDGIQRLDLSTRLDLPTSPEACAWYRNAVGDAKDDSIQRLDPHSCLGAPKTPKHSDDVTPVTKNEWHWLTGDWPRMAAVETC